MHPAYFFLARLRGVVKRTTSSGAFVLLQCCTQGRGAESRRHVIKEYRSVEIHIVNICEASLYCSRVMFLLLFCQAMSPRFHFEDVHVAIFQLQVLRHPTSKNHANAFLPIRHGIVLVSQPQPIKLTK